MRLKKTLLISLLLGSIASQYAKAEVASPFAFNVGVVSDYRYRGLTQTNYKPAVQGGVDVTLSGGFYAGIWGSRITWLNPEAHLELDYYGGYKFSVNGVDLDVGYLRYVYPQDTGTTNANTDEMYMAGTYKSLTIKFSQSNTNLFAVAGSKSSRYIDVSYGMDVGSGWTLTPHVGSQIVNNNKDLSYQDVSLTASKELAPGVTFSASTISTTLSGSTYNPGMVLGVKYAF